MFDLPPEWRDGLVVLQYKLSLERLEDIRSAYPEHLAHLDAVGAAGQLWLIGRLGGPEDGDVLAVLQNRSNAERFVENDPLFVRSLAKVGAMRDWAPAQYGH